MSIPRDIQEEILLKSHPYSSQLCGADKSYASICNNERFLRKLMRKWLFPGMNIPYDYPVLNYSQIAEYALFYYPIPESIGKFHPLSLYYRASLVYPEDDCRIFLDEAIKNAFEIGFSEYDHLSILPFIADAAGQNNLLLYMYDKFKPNLLDNRINLVRKNICCNAALLLDDRDKFDVSYRGFTRANIGLVIDGMQNDREELYEQLFNNYIPGYNLRRIDEYMRRLLEWEGLITELELYERSYSSGTYEEGFYSLIGSALGSLIEGKNLQRPISLSVLADYLTEKNIDTEEIPRETLLSFRPDLLSDEELSLTKKLNFIQTDNFYYYFLFPNAEWEEIHYYQNHLGVSGYNYEIITKAKEKNVIPEEYNHILDNNYYGQQEEEDILNNIPEDF